MSIAMAEVVCIDTLDNIVFVYENAEKVYDNKSIDEDIREYIYSTFDILDSHPKGLPLMEDVIDDYENGIDYSDDDLVICLARVGDLFSSPYYNRIRDLRYGNQEKHLKENSGFSYAAADTLSAYYRPKQKKAVVTKGNNRASKLYGVTRDPNVRIPIGLKFHPRTREIEECVKVESNNHNMDCNYRTNQSGDHKFTSALRAEEDWAINLYNYLKQFDIGIAGTLPNARFHCPSHSYISRARGKKGANDVYVTRFLKAFTSKKCCDAIQGNTVISGSLFLRYFEPYIRDVDTKNGFVDSFADSLDWAFNNWETEIKPINPNAKNITQEMITCGNSDYKKHEPMVARWVHLYNTYCSRLNTAGNQNTAIPLENSKETDNRWNKFVSESNSLVQGSLYNIAKQGLKFM